MRLLFKNNFYHCTTTWRTESSYLEDNLGVLECSPTWRTEGQFTVYSLPILHSSSHGLNGDHLLLLVGHV